MVDWNRLAYTAGQMARNGVDRLNSTIDAGERRVRESIYRYQRDAGMDGDNGGDGTGPSFDMESIKDSQATIKGWYGPGRLVVVLVSESDPNGGSHETKGYYRIHDTQRSDDAVAVIAQTLYNKLEVVGDDVDIINAVDPYEGDCRVLVGVEKTRLARSQTIYDDVDMKARVLAMVYTVHMTLPDAELGVSTVPYVNTDRLWPWDANDESKWSMMASEFRPSA